MPSFKIVDQCSVSYGEKLNMKYRIGIIFMMFMLAIVSGFANAQEGHGHGGMAMTMELPQVGPDVIIRFGAMVGDSPFSCGMIYSGLGSQKSVASVNDYRFFVSNLRLINMQGEEVPVELTQDGVWQYENVALLDFEDGTGMCSETGNADLNYKIVGTIPEDDYNGVIFDLGIPFELNHLDTTTAPSPLNIPAMWWNWQVGYKFVRIDLQTPTSQTPAWFIHLGSTGCQSLDSSTPPTEPCAHSNINTVKFEEFNPTQNFVIADLAGLLMGVNLDESTIQPPGCMSGIDDPDCVNLFPAFGLDLPTGQPAEATPQTFFRVLGNVQADHAHGEMSHEHTAEMPSLAGLSDTEIIEVLSKHTFETVDNPLTVEPIVIHGDYAISGWVQGEMGGRAFWQRVDGNWLILLCSGASLKEIETLVALDMSQEDATSLATALAEAEATLSSDTIARFDSFNGTVDLRNSPTNQHGMTNHN